MKIQFLDVYNRYSAGRDSFDLIEQFNPSLFCLSGASQIPAIPFQVRCGCTQYLKSGNMYTYIDVFTILDVLIWIITFFIIVYLHDVYLYILRYIISIENNTWMCGNI